MKKIILLIVVLCCVFFVQATAFGLMVTGASSIGDKVSLFGDVTIDKETSGSVVVVKGNADIQNNINGDVVVVFGDVTINAKVSGDVISVFGTVSLTDQGVVGGDMVSIGTMHRSDKAVINGQDTVIDLGSVKIGDLYFNFFVLLKLAILIVFTLFVLLLGFPILAIWKKRFMNISSDIETRIGKKLTTGLLGFVICLVTLVLLFVTLIIPLAYFFISILIELVVSIFIGKLVLRLFNNESSIYIQFIIGLIILVFLKVLFIFMIPVNGLPAGLALSFGFDLLVKALGIGILVDSNFGNRRSA